MKKKKKRGWRGGVFLAPCVVLTRKPRRHAVTLYTQLFSIFSKPVRLTLAVIVRRLVDDLPEKAQSSFVSSAAITLRNLNGLGATPIASSRDALPSKTKTISHTSSGLCPCHPLEWRDALISTPSPACSTASLANMPTGMRSGCPL